MKRLARLRQRLRVEHVLEQGGCIILSAFFNQGWLNNIPGERAEDDRHSGRRTVRIYQSVFTRLPVTRENGAIVIVVKFESLFFSEWCFSSRVPRGPCCKQAPMSKRSQPWARMSGFTNPNATKAIASI